MGVRGVAGDRERSVDAFRGLPRSERVRFSRENRVEFFLDGEIVDRKRALAALRAHAQPTAATAREPAVAAS